MPGRLVILTNIPTPYRTAFFDVLSMELNKRGGDLRIFYCATSERGRKWDPQSLLSHGTVMPGISPTLRGVTFHVNPSAARLIQETNPDWLLVAGSWNTPTMLNVLTRLRGKVPRIFWSEGHALAVRHDSGPIASLRRRVLRQFDGFAVPNSRSESFVVMETAQHPPIIRLPNTVDEGFFDPSFVDPATIRKRLGIPKDAIIVSTVASLDCRKRVLESAEAFAQLSPRQRDGMHFVIVGDGPLRGQIEMIASRSSNLHTLGHLEAKQVREVLVASDAFLLASSYDPNPLSVIEAALCGCHLITTESVGNADELVRPTGGTVVAEALGANLVSTLKNAFSEFKEAAHQNAGSDRNQRRQYTLAHYSRSQVAADLCSNLVRTWPNTGTSR